MINKLLFLVAIIFLAACANVVPPNGGPVDKTPPVCIKKTPADNTLNFKEKGIDFTFDEYVVLNEITNQFIISPPLEKQPNIKIKGKKIELVFDEPLKPNTTYTLNFGNGIKDINEGNILTGLTYTFSTGSYIDSLTFKGKVTDAYTLLPAKDIAVGLFKIEDDSTIFKIKPWYLTRPDSSGNFSFNYLSPAKYELIAFEDANKNLKIESNEKIAFYKELITLDYSSTDSTEYNILVSPQYIALNPKLITYRELAKGKYQIITAGSNCNITIDDNIANKKETQIIKKSDKNCDTIIVYTNAECVDSVKMKINIDTVIEKIVIPCKSSKYNSFSVSSSVNFNNYDFLKPLKLSFTNPPIDVRQKEIRLLQDSVAITNYTLITDSTNPLNLLLVYPFKEESKYTITLPKASIRDIYEQEIDSTGIAINTAAVSFFGNLSIVIDKKENSQLIVQLLDAETKIVQENVLTKSNKIAYNNLLPGRYFIKVIDDSNQNKQWDGGNYFIKKYPEKVYITPTAIDIRANWDITDLKVETGL